MSKQPFDFGWMTDETASLFHGLVLGELKHANLVHASEDNRYNDMSVAALMAFKKAHPQFEESGDVIDLVPYFRNWVKDWEALSGAGELESLNIQISMRVQTVDGEFWIQLGGKVREDGNITAARRYMQGQLVDQVKQMGLGVKQENRIERQNQQFMEGARDHGEEWDSDLISINLYQGKNQARIHGGRWTKFGVPIYAEVLKEFGLELDKMPPGQYPGKYHAWIELNSDGKPVRAKKIVKV